MQNRILIILLVNVIAMLYSCGKEEKYPIEPVITFKSVDVIGKSGFKLVLGFTDGDGDIGFPKNDTSGDYNCFIDLSIKTNGVFTPLALKGSYNSRIPDITPDERNKNIRGDIIIFPQNGFVDSSYFNNPVDTFKIDVYILDRANHHSNSVTTPEFLFTRS